MVPSEPRTRVHSLKIICTKSDLGDEGGIDYFRLMSRLPEIAR